LSDGPPTGGPLIVGLGGTVRPASTSELALSRALDAARAAGARTQLFGGDFLAELPIFDPRSSNHHPQCDRLLASVRSAQGLIVASPGYHGSISGLVKNALDCLEALRDDERPYLDGRAVGCIVTAAGGQAGGSTLAALRSIVHALRGWPTPLGIAFNPSAAPLFDADGALCERDARQIDMIAAQVVEFARMKAG
jgi:FMN reductase